mmetsp:Transcript_28258/g.87892  ORF Transcript_28258/g.87892 Transcript_28258/m.87892 type:complete len:277 (-) Transcript_28258:387-1217(-)
MACLEGGFRDDDLLVRRDLLAELAGSVDRIAPVDVRPVDAEHVADVDAVAVDADVGLRLVRQLRPHLAHASPALQDRQDGVGGVVEHVQDVLLSLGIVAGEHFGESLQALELHGEVKLGIVGVDKGEREHDRYLLHHVPVPQLGVQPLEVGLRELGGVAPSKGEQWALQVAVVFQAGQVDGLVERRSYLEGAAHVFEGLDDLVLLLGDGEGLVLDARERRAGLQLPARGGAERYHVAVAQLLAEHVRVLERAAEQLARLVQQRPLPVVDAHSFQGQ